MRDERSKAFAGRVISQSLDGPYVAQEFHSSVGKLALPVILLMCMLLLGGCNSYGKYALGVHGGCAPSSSPFLSPDTTVDGQITYCEGGDKWTGTLESQVYPAGTQNVVVMLSGYPGYPGVSVHAINDAGVEALIPVSRQPRDRWQPMVLQVPREVSKAAYRIRINDQATGSFGWAGMGGSTLPTGLIFAKGALPILAAALFGNAWLIAVSLCLPTTAHPRESLRNGLLAGGTLWFTLFNTYVFSLELGNALTWILSIAPFPLAIFIGWRRRRLIADILAMQNSLLPALAVAFLVLWTGLFPFYWNGEPDGAPASRWWPSLAIDAWLPMLFGNMLESGKLLVPMTGDWLSSDRPPLQTGLYLLVYKLIPGSRELVYQGISSWAQALALLPLASLTERFMTRRAQIAALLTLSLSALMILNTLFVWPKLLAAAFCLIYYIAAFPDGGKPRHWGQAGVAAALALLAHGGALFFLVGASVVHLAWYRRNSLGMLIRTAAVTLALYGPWIAYQRLIDPPGNRLVKWHLAGKIPVSNEGALHAIFSAYSQLTPATWLSSRMENVATITKGAISVLRDAPRTAIERDPNALRDFINDDFYGLFHSMWFASPLLLLPGLALICWRTKHKVPNDVALNAQLKLVQLAATVIIATTLWAIVIFRGGEATIHVGAYASTLALQLVVLSIAWHTSKTLFYTICTANIIVALSVYIFDRRFLPGLNFIYVLGNTLFCSGLLAAIASSTAAPGWHAIRRPLSATSLT
ncbi:hypothetical protein [uncultured Xanthomonas sp.]|uniref:hypothetical protein n=1 Tax=uncultured Xanthomonas sp. TaxID=152831 RepID=UPI0025EE78E3|nr:hypothetical protein [uncultured Xanthomonas sp.]